MSGPVQPPLTVQTIDGTTTGRPITTIKVTNGDLTVSVDVATIDTSGGGGGGMTSFDLAADSGATQSIGNGDTLSVLGGTGLASVASATDTVTLNIENTLVSGTTPDYYDALTINAQGQVTAVAAGTAPQAALTLTTTGTSGAATLVGATLNIPQYSGGGGSPGTPAKSVQFNSDPAGTFTGSSKFLWTDSANTLSLGSGAGASQIESGSDDLVLQAGTTATPRGKITLDYDGTNPKITLATETGAGDIELKPATGKVVVGSGSVAGTLSSNGAFDLILETNSGTNSGAITITDGANGNITINPDGTGTVGLGNFIFDVDQRGGASQDAYVLTYTNSTGEISLKEAGGGGSTSLTNLGSTGTLSAETRYEISCMPPFSGTSGASVNYESIPWADDLFGFCFIAKVSGQLSELGVKFGSTSGGIEVAIYDSNSEQLPGSLLGSGTMTYGLSFQEVYDTSLTAPTSGTVGSLVAGDLYWAVYLRGTAGTGSLMASGASSTQRAAILQVSGPTDTDGVIYRNADYAAGDTFPDTLSNTNALAANGAVPKITYKVS